MVGDARKAQEVFHNTLREAAQRAAQGELPNEQFWLFRDARWRCLEASKTELEAEPLEMKEEEITAGAVSQIERLEPTQLAIWISAAPEPQRTALALFYLDEFNYREMMSMLGLKLTDLSRAIASGRREFQACLNTTVPAAASE